MEDERRNASGSSFISQSRIQGLPGYSSLQDFLTVLRDEQSKLGLETTNQTIVAVIQRLLINKIKSLRVHNFQQNIQYFETPRFIDNLMKQLPTQIHPNIPHDTQSFWLRHVFQSNARHLREKLMPLSGEIQCTRALGPPVWRNWWGAN